jgi:hypothetical protein
VEHATRLTSVELVFSRRLTQEPLEGTGNEPNWPVSDTPILKWPSNVVSNYSHEQLG